MRAVLLLLAMSLAAAAGQAQLARADTVRLSLRWEITEEASAVAESLGVLSGVAVDGKGNVYVSDRSNARLWVFDASGRSQRGIGRKGQGPGEFQSPTGIVVGPDGKLWVRDAQRVSRFVEDPATKRLTRFESSFTGPPLSDWTSDLASRFTANGGYTYPAFNVIKAGATQHGQYLILSPDGKVIDSIPVPLFPDAPRSFARVQLDANNGRMLPGLGHVPFAPLPAWDVTPRGTVLWGDAKSYVIREVTKTGALVREFRRAGPPTRIPSGERAESTAALKSRLDTLRYPRAQVIGAPPEVFALKLPEAYPAYMAVYAGVDGRVWVRRWVPNGHARSVFDVFEADGRFRTTVLLPRDLAPYPTPVLSIEEGVAAVGIDRASGAFTILRFGPTGR